jgi:hypothetical protein
MKPPALQRRKIMLKTRAQTILTTAISDAATSVIVASVSDFPAAPFSVIFDPGTTREEVMLVTAVDDFTKTFTVVRAQQDTLAVAHPVKSLIYFCGIDPTEISVQGGVIRVAKNSAIDTIQKAFDLVTEDLKTILVEPGEYDEPLTWPTISEVRLIGLSSQWDTVIKDSTEEAQVLAIAPGAQDASWSAAIENIYISHAFAGQDGIAVVHTGVGKKLNLYLKNVGGEADSDSDKFIVVTHGGDGNAVRIYWEGNNGGVDGLIYFETKDAGDRLFVDNVELLGGIQTSADAVAITMRFRHCLLKHGGGAGGNGAQVLAALGCFSITGTTLAAADADEFPTSTATIVP